MCSQYRFVLVTCRHIIVSLGLQMCVDFCNSNTDTTSGGAWIVEPVLQLTSTPNLLNMFHCSRDGIIGATDYSPAFYAMEACMVATIITIFVFHLHVSLPEKAHVRQLFKVRRILTKDLCRPGRRETLHYSSKSSGTICLLNQLTNCWEHTKEIQGISFTDLLPVCFTADVWWMVTKHKNNAAFKRVTFPRSFFKWQDVSTPTLLAANEWAVYFVSGHEAPGSCRFHSRRGHPGIYVGLLGELPVRLPEEAQCTHLHARWDVNSVSTFALLNVPLV